MRQQTQTGSPDAQPTCPRSGGLGTPRRAEPVPARMARVAGAWGGIVAVTTVADEPAPRAVASRRPHRNPQRVGGWALRRRARRIGPDIASSPVGVTESTAVPSA